MMSPDHYTVKPKIALFGYYNSDNWGDNLMALIFAFILKQQNVSFSVFIKNVKIDYYSELIKNTDDTIEEFLTDKDIAIYGGGGILVPGDYTPTAFSEDLNALIKICRKKNIPIYGISIGGIGNPDKELTPPFRHQFLKSIKFATVRSQQDLPLLKKFGKNGHFFHDILWLTPDFFNMKERSNKKLTIGINCQTTKTGIIGKIFWKIFRICLYIAAKRMPEFEFIFIDSKIATDQSSKFSPMRAYKSCKNMKEYKFSSLNQDMEIINQLDIIFSDKLHLGLVCLSYGKPFISVAGQLKTKLMLNNIGLSSVYYGTYRAFLLPILLLSKSFILKQVNHFKLPNKKEIVESSRGHINELANIISNYNN